MKAMASNEGEGAGPSVSLGIGVNQGSVPPDSESLCEFCQRLPVREVGFNHSSTHFADYRHLQEILKESKTCLFCREVAKFYNEWSRKTFGNKVPIVEDRAAAMYAHNMVHFQLHNERHATNISPKSGHETASLNRIWVWFIVSKPSPDHGYFRPVVQFQKCSQPPLQVSNGGSLRNWESGEQLPYSGRIRPLVAEAQLFRKWKESCGATHGGHCNSIYSGTRPTWLRLIDVKERCVIDTRVFKSYVALSYVWGEGKLLKCGKVMPKLTKDTENDFRKPRSLTREKVLSTIDDAIEVTQGLGEEYIWVDCLCIMQDNKDDQGEFISQMDFIYGHASVTIVAASGDNADAGLCGVKPNSRTHEQKHFTIKGVSLLQTLDPVGSKDRNPNQYHYLEDSVWLMRGWTFQEKIFSTKLLLFTEEQVYWECQKATWCEDGLWETMQSPIVYRPCFSKDFRHPWSSDADGLRRIYQELVFEYSRRNLTYQSDVLDAFEGVLNSLRRETHQDFLWALPTSLLSSSLTWSCGEQPIQRRRSMCSVRSSIRATECPFPSWSWVGWNGAVKYFIWQTSDLDFYSLNSEGQLHRVGAADGTQSISSRHTGRIAESFHSHPNVRKHIGRTAVTLEEIPEGVLSQSIASNILFFWSSTAKCHVRHSDRELDQVDEPILIHNDEYVECEWTQMPLLEPGREEEPAELVVIGGDNRIAFAVLLVDWKDGVAYRRGLATIIAPEWFKLGSIWKMITLG